MAKPRRAYEAAAQRDGTRAARRTRRREFEPRRKRFANDGVLKTPSWANDGVLNSPSCANDGALKSPSCANDGVLKSPSLADDGVSKSPSFANDGFLLSVVLPLRRAFRSHPRHVHTPTPRTVLTQSARNGHKTFAFR